MNENCNKIPEVARLWVLNFTLKDGGKGTALIKANNPDKATKILRNNGFYNGTPYYYNIYQIEEVVVPPLEDLVSEQILTLNED